MKDDMSTNGNEQTPVTPFAYLLEETAEAQTSLPASAPRAGEPCPHCGEGVLDYDGLLNLHCPQCGYMLAGCFT